MVFSFLERLVCRSREEVGVEGGRIGEEVVFLVLGWFVRSRKVMKFLWFVGIVFCRAARVRYVV